MTLQDRIAAAMRDSMRARDARRTTTLRGAMAAAHNREIELRRPLTDADTLDVLARQLKQRRESIEMYRAGGREERAADEEAEAAILSEFMPEQLSQPDIERMVREAIAQTGARGASQMGMVMGRLAPQIKGRADGRVVSELVRAMLGDDAATDLPAERGA